MNLSPEPNSTLFDATEPLPDYLTVRTGWRIWELHADGTLYSPYKRTPWIPRQALTAVCSDGSHTNFHNEHCGGGIHATKLPEHALTWALPRLHKERRVQVLGQVSLWGHVIEGETGYRAQKAYPKQFYLSRRQDARFRTLLETQYGVPVVSGSAHFVKERLHASLRQLRYFIPTLPFMLILLLPLFGSRADSYRLYFAVAAGLATPLVWYASAVYFSSENHGSEEKVYFMSLYVIGLLAALFFAIAATGVLF